MEADVTTGRPEWLRAALKQHPTPDRAARSSDQADLEPGDLWVFSEEIKPFAGVQRVLLVLDTDVRNASVVAAMTSVEVAFAGDRDVVLSADQGLPYPLMVETGLVASVPWSHARERVAMLDDKIVDALIDFIWGDRPEELESLRGHAWLDPAVEERVDFEAAELRDIQKLGRRTDSRFGGHESDIEPAITLSAISAAVSYAKGLTFAPAVLAHDPDRSLYVEMLARPILDRHTSEPGTLVSRVECPIGTVSDLRLLSQPLVDALLSGARVTAANCIDGVERYLFEAGRHSGSDWIVVCSPQLADEFGRSGLVGRTDDDRAVFVIGVTE
ncbi:MAG TPA: hypothetical protein DCR14_18580 [Acidimicrobiaceae bacterium]|nr:hypothetical protein [Acidimicrobiaceae bacterium]